MFLSFPKCLTPISAISQKIFPQVEPARGHVLLHGPPERVLRWLTEPLDLIQDDELEAHLGLGPNHRRRLRNLLDHLLNDFWKRKKRSSGGEEEQRDFDTGAERDSGTGAERASVPTI